ncbi:12797_t:CDS:2 [Entrophospora sp. SA101]|nr:12797_t:CDS:2 [Entrophospora sp. SA101]
MAYVLNVSDLKILNTDVELAIPVVARNLNDSADIKEDFLQEIANHKMFTSVRIVKCHGISQDPQTENYLMVMDYIKDGDLRSFLRNKSLAKAKKYDDFKKALNLIFQKSDELEKIITTNELTISEEMKSKLIEIKALKARVSELEAEGNNAYQELERKKQQLEVLKNTIISNKPTKEINQLCQYQEEITKLKTQLEETARQGEKQITQVINNITVGSMNVQGGHALFGNQMGNETNLSYNKSADLSETINSKRKKRNS